VARCTENKMRMQDAEKVFCVCLFAKHRDWWTDVVAVVFIRHWTQRSVHW